MCNKIFCGQSAYIVNSQTKQIKFKNNNFIFLCPECLEQQQQQQQQQQKSLIYRFDTPTHRIFWGIIGLSVVWGIFKLLWKLEEFTRWLDSPVSADSIWSDD